jgi:glycosyltransferase involved in cell wall biosynthesis
MKVLMLCPSLAGAGVERRICTLLKELVEDGVDVQLGLLRNEGEFLQDASHGPLVFIPCHSLLTTMVRPISSYPDMSTVFTGMYQIRKLLLKVRPDVLVTFTLETTIPMYFVSHMKPGRQVKWIISEDSNTAKATLDGAFPRSSLLVRYGLRRIYRRADHISCVSRAVRKSVIRTYGVDASRLSILHNPVDLDKINSAMNKVPIMDGGNGFIVAVGRLVRVKQFDLLIRSFAQARKSSELRLVILGEGEEQQALVRIADRLGVKDQVLFPGFVDNPWVYMSSARMLVLTSMHEGFGNVILEAMASGCPVISTHCGGPEDIIRHRENGLLVEPDHKAIAKAIELLLDNPGLAENLAKNARLGLHRYDPRVICSQFRGILEEVAISDGQRLIKACEH